MSSGLKILSLAEALAAYSAARQTLVSQNLAHADTPGFRARDLAPFSESFAARAAAEPEGAFRPAATRAGHMAGAAEAEARPLEAAEVGAASPNGNTVSIEDQMVRATELRMQHELALGVYRKSLEILRAAMTAPR